MRVVDRGSVFIELENEYGQVENQQILIVSDSGGGKGLALESIAEEYWKKGYVVIAISDPKHELELAYGMWKPKETYHLKNLKLIGKEAKSKPIKIYHPFTFNIPTSRKLPDINFFTIPLKSLGQREWNLITETSGENDVVSLLLKASNDISKKEGLFSFVNYIYEIAGSEIKKVVKKHDLKNFLLPTKSGTVKEVTRITNFLRAFQRHYFLSANDSQYNLDWKRIINDNSCYHVFVSNYIGKQDEKVTDFLVLYLLESILNNKNYAKKPIVVLIPEIRVLTPFKPEGHKKYLAESIKRSLSLLRSSGKGISSICDTQVITGVDEEVRESMTKTFYGALSNKDIEHLTKTLHYPRDTQAQLLKPDARNTFIMRKEEGSGGFTIFMPESRHCEPHYNFEEMYRQENPELMKNYGDLVRDVKKSFEEDQKLVKKKIEKREKEIKEVEEEKKREKEIKEQEKQEKEEQKGKVKQVQEKSKEMLMKLCYEMFNNSDLDKKERTYRKIGQKFEINHVTVKKYIEKYELKLKENESVDFENQVLEELNG